MAESNPIERKCENMNKRISEINKSTGGESRDKRPCVFKFDQISDNDRFIPQVVSIGPYCRGNPRLQRMEEFKWQCLAYSLKKSKKSLEDYWEKIRPLEQEAKECYSESSARQLNDFLEMMVLDGCLIVEFIRFSYPIRREEKREQSVMKSHPLARMERANLPKICADLLMLQNQIPYKVLEQVFEVSKLEGEPQSFSTLSVKFFSAILGFHYPLFSSPPKVDWMHLLDLVRSILIPSNYKGWSPDAKETSGGEQMPLKYQYKPFDTIPCVTKLRRKGIRVRPHLEDGLVVNFHRGVIEMPKIILNDLMCAFLENCVALEQRHNDRSKHFSVYALCLDCLVNSASDVDYLCERRVIENYLKTDEKAAKFFNSLGKGLTFDWDYFDFFLLCRRVNGYYENTYRQHWTSFKGEYFHKPWLWISGFVALVLLVLTFMQTYCAMYDCVHHKN